MGSLRAAYKFTGVRLLAITGWPISMRTLVVLGLSLGTAMILAVLAGSLMVLRLVRDVLMYDGGVGTHSSAGARATVIVLALAICFYLSVGALAREAFSSRRFAVRLSPNADLYRATDVSMHHVFLAEVGPRSLLLFGLVSAICTAAWIAAQEDARGIVPVAWTLPVAPFAAVASWLALSSRLASKDPRSPTLTTRTLTSIGGCLLGILLGFLVARGTLALTRRTAKFDLQFDAPATGGYWIAGAAGVAVVVFCVLAIRNISAVRRQSFQATAKVRRRSGVLSSKAPKPLTMLMGTLMVNLVRDRYFSMFCGIGAALILLATVAMGFRLGGGDPELFPEIPGIQNAGACVVFMVGVVGSELISKSNNPIGLLPQLRYGWESGFGTGTLVWIVILTQTVPLAVVAAPSIGVCVWALTGVVPVTTFLIPWSIATGNIVGNAYSNVKVKQADGSMEMSLAAAFISLLLAVPVLGLCLMNSAAATIAAVVYSVLLTGGARHCLQRRILVLK